MITEIIDLPAEIVLWMIYVKKFDPIKQKYKVKLRFDPKFVYFEATHNTQLYQVKQAAQEAYKVGTMDYDLRFLMKDTKLIYNYHLYIKMIKTQEYKDLTKKFDGLCIMVKDKFIKLQHELSENAGYRGDVKMSLPNSYVLAWMPRSKANHIVQLLNQLLYNATSLMIKPIDAIWFSLYVEDIQKTHNSMIEFQQNENHIEIKMPSTTVKDSVQQLFQQHSLLQIPYELDEVQFDIRDIEQLLKRKCNNNVQLWTQQKVIQIAQKIDQKYCTNIQNQIMQLTKSFRQSLYIFGRPDQEHQSILNLRNYIEQRMQNGLESIIKDYIIVTETNGFQLHFYNKQVGLQLVNNHFDQNDFDQFLAQNYNLPYEVKVHKADSNLLSFFVKVLSNQREIKNIIIEMLYGYVNHSFYYIVDDIKLPNIGQQYNCKIEAFRSNTLIRGLVDIYGFEQQQIDQCISGNAIVLKVSNLLHSKKTQIINYFNEQLKSDIYQQMANDKQMSQITKTCDGNDEHERCKILQLTQSQLQIIKQHKLDYQTLKQADNYLEESYFVAIQFKGNKLSQAIEHIKSQEKYFLSTWATDKEIIEIEKNKNYDLYQVYIEEFFLEYYTNIRIRLLNSQESEITMEKQQVQFYIDITQLNVPILNLVPIITVIQQIYKIGITYNQLNELQPGRYLLGYALTNTKEVQLQQTKFIIRNIVQIHVQ